MSTKIEWADKTVNVAWGCKKVSPGCEHCYAERISAVRASHPNPKIAAMYDGVVDVEGHWSNRVNMLRELPRLSGNGKRIFVGSMTDLFRAGITDDFLIRLWRWMEGYPQHTFQILTKRTERMANLLNRHFPNPLPHVWGMTTVCNQSEADEKIPHLLRAPLAVRGISVEPMLRAVDLGEWLFPPERTGVSYGGLPEEVAGAPLLDWVICGGETGPGARPMHPDWVRGLRDQCAAAGVPFFFKGWGEWCPRFNHYLHGMDDSANMIDPTEKRWETQEVTVSGETGLAKVPYRELDWVTRVGKRRAGRLLDGREWNEVPEVSC